MAQDFSQEVYFCRDSSGKLDVSQALTKPHKLLTKSALGRDNSYFWLRVKLPNTNGKVFVELQSPYLNSVEGYLVKNTSVLRRFKVMSQNTPFSKRIFEHHNFVFPIDKRLNDSTDLYLRIHRKRLNVTAPIRIYNEADFMKYLRQKDRTYSLFNGFMVSLIILSISLYLFFREKTLLIYLVLFVLSTWQKATSFSIFKGLISSSKSTIGVIFSMISLLYLFFCSFVVLFGKEPHIRRYLKSFFGQA